MIFAQHDSTFSLVRGTQVVPAVADKISNDVWTALWEWARPGWYTDPLNNCQLDIEAMRLWSSRDIIFRD